jgi:hypothetical protein
VIEAFSEVITELLSNGWVLYGGHVVTPYIHESNARFDEDRTEYSQALVRGRMDELMNCAVPRPI